MCRLSHVFSTCISSVESYIYSYPLLKILVNFEN
jgi:hypothetical protein